MMRGTGTLASLRQLNRSRVLAVLQQRGRASRAEIVRTTGLSRTTVSSLVANLLAEGVVVEGVKSVGAAPSSTGGRPPIFLELDPASGAFVGLDFAHDHVQGAVADRSGRLLADDREVLEVDHHPDHALGAATRIVTAALGRAGVAPARVLGVGAAVSAPLRSHQHRFASDRIFPGWAEVDLPAALGSRLGVPVRIGNDANLGALAEATFGAARGLGNFVYVMLSAGVGAGIILDGRLYEGATGTAGEIGHVVVDPGGQVCRCGNRGCLETVAGAVALTSSLRHTHGTRVNLDTVLRLSDDGDSGARRLIADAGEAVGRALAGVCSVLDPELIVIGGELAAAGDVLLDAIRETIDRLTSPATGHSYPVQRGALGARAEALGAIALAMNHSAERGVESLAASG